MGKKKDKEKTVQLVKLNWDKEYEKDIRSGRGFHITERAIKNKEEKSMHGIHSPIFATDWEDEDAFAERYSCKCKDLKGRVFEGEVCKVCGTPVIFRDVDLSIFGWIRLKEFFVIQPIFYKLISSIIGDKVFPEIIEYDKDITRDGQVIDKVNKNPFKGIGLIEFYDRFDEIIEYYRLKKKNKADAIEDLLKDRDKIFTKSIPVFSSILRPMSFRNESFFFYGIDKKYNSVFSLVSKINQGTFNTTRKHSIRMDEPTTLTAIQKRLNELWTLIFQQINQKDGHIKDQILGGRINFSGRNVIIPDPSLRADEIKLGYLTFLELYKYEIIAHLVRIGNITENQAFDEWYRATINFDPKVYEVMQYLLKKYDLILPINRNPTINYGSLLSMRIVDVHREYREDYTMSIPIQVLPVLNADFDGDILNQISMKTKDLSDSFDKAFNPRKNMFISRNDGLFNNDFNLMKDQLIGLYEFNNI